MNIRPSQFQKLILGWFDQHGRKHFPWQQNKTPYRVWVSEIMLQQTQVSTVVPYYEKFMKQFPDLKSLAAAPEDEVLHLWAGLGYYGRARNLHRAAKTVMKIFNGRFPDTLRDLQTLCGVGRSTAGAIFSLAYDQQAAILDGNVKRVLARFLAITESVTDKKVEETLWAFAERYTSKKHPADYTQAMMDLGATICTRTSPSCGQCPLVKHCLAYEQGIVHLTPARKVTRELPVRTATFLIFQKNERVLLHKRSPMGIWGGLWSFPEMADEPTKESIQAYCQKQFKVTVTKYQLLDSFRHTFSHYHLNIHPVVIPVKRIPATIMEDDHQIWYNPSEPAQIGLPRPVEFIMRKLR